MVRGAKVGALGWQGAKVKVERGGRRVTGALRIKVRASLLAGGAATSLAG